MIQLQTSIKDFKEQLGAFREKKGFTQSEVSKYTGLDLSFYQSIENGHDEPELDVLLTIADTLEVELRGLAS
jgi:transcriptional regulator with XRE-family HTH domain